MIWLALRLSLHNRTRFAVTLVGVIFSSYLTLTEVALYIGMMENATAVIRHVGADLWATSKGIRNLDFAKPFPEERVKQVLALRDVLWARPIMLTWGFLKLASGAQEQVEIVGYDPLSLVGAPWEMAKGSARAVRGGPFIILDETSWRHVGDLRIGSAWELNDYPVRLVVYRVLPGPSLLPQSSRFSDPPMSGRLSASARRRVRPNRASGATSAGVSCRFGDVPPGISRDRFSTTPQPVSPPAGTPRQVLLP